MVMDDADVLEANESSDDDAEVADVVEAVLADENNEVAEVVEPAVFAFVTDEFMTRDEDILCSAMCVWKYTFRIRKREDYTGRVRMEESKLERKRMG